MNSAKQKIKPHLPFFRRFRRFILLRLNSATRGTSDFFGLSRFAASLNFRLTIYVIRKRK